MSTRTYLSIGDVLTLLREEFPDVTISKIRFLESQGLVNPERSPSGYRKFFDHDVERLRWVLRQQREHFLPLKVIRDRLADGDLEERDLDDGDLEEPAGEVPNGKPTLHVQRAQAGHASAPDASPELLEEHARADAEAMARILADATRRAALRPDDAQPRRGLQIVGENQVAAPVDAEEAAVTHSEARQPVHAGAPSPAAVGASRQTGETAAAGNLPAKSRRGGVVASSEPPADDAETLPGTAGAASAPSGSGGAPGPAPKNPPKPGRGSDTGGNLTVEELCEASRLSPEEVAGLISFGLIESVNVAGIQTFDDDALALANLAAAFRSFGIEPRHLRLYRNAVDREVGLIEQVVIPLLRQRNPESRQRAADGAEELASLGQAMRATLLRLALRQHLGG